MLLIGKEIPASDCGGSTSEEEIPEEVIPRVVKRKAIPGDLSRRTRFTSGARETSFRTIAGLYCSPVIPHEQFRVLAVCKYLVPTMGIVRQVKNLYELL